MAVSDDLKKFIGYVPPAGSKEACVYIYEQLETGKTYIGSTLNGYGRFIQHTSALERNKHINRKFQRAFNESPFFQVTHVKPPPNVPDSEMLGVIRSMEQKLIDDFDDKKKLLNIAKDVFSVGGGISPSEETREKLRKAMTGRIVSEETRKRQSDALKGREFTEERKKAISNSKVSVPVKVGDVLYKSAGMAAKALGIEDKNLVKHRARSPNYPEYEFVPIQMGNHISL